MALTIGNITLSHDAVLGPMAGVSDLGFRSLARSYGAGLTYTEMISVCGLNYRNKQTEILTTVAPCETPCAVQLFGHDPEDFAKGVRAEVIDKFDIIDINMGCPVQKVVSRGEGSALMKDPFRAADIVRAVKEGAGSRPVTVKIRLGWDRLTAPEFALAMERAGADMVTVHGRTRTQFYQGSADWDAIAEVKRAVNIPLVANGDVKSADDYRRIKEVTACDGVMIARGAIGHTSIFAEVRGADVEVDLKKDFLFQMDMLSKTYSDHVVCNLLKPHLISAVSGRAGAKEYRLKVGAAKTTEEIKAIIMTL